MSRRRMAGPEGRPVIRIAAWWAGGTAMTAALHGDLWRLGWSLIAAGILIGLRDRQNTAPASPAVRSNN